MPPELESWQREMLARIELQDATFAARYLDPGRLAHYRRLSTFLWEETHDQDLARAAFLHGVRDPAQLARLGLEPEGTLGRILQDRVRLRDIDEGGSDVAEHIVADFLPSLQDPRSVALAAIEFLDHLDPGLSVRAFTRRFQQSPDACLRDFRPVADGFANAVADVNFIRTVAAPAARFAGLWFLQNLAEDVSFFYTEPQRFASLLDFVLKSENKCQVEDRRDRIREALIKLDLPQQNINWEWHHIASLGRRISRQGDAAELHAKLSACGMVTVVCPSPEMCYRVVATLHMHECWHHQTRGIDDWIGSPSDSAYEAFHTVLAPRSKDGMGWGAPSIRVRVIPLDAQEKRFQILFNGWGNRFRSRPLAGSGKRLLVFANDGSPRFLRPGSGILNFAASIHHRMVAYAGGATVNGEHVSVLHHLKEGDVVHLQLAAEPVPLPQEWQAHVAPGTERRIVKAHKRYFQPGQINKGRQLLRERMGPLPVAKELDVDTLDGYLEEALSAAKDRHIPVCQPAWFLRQLVTGDLPGDSIQRVVDTLRNLLSSARRLAIEGLEVPSELREIFEQIVLCPECKPTVDSDVAATVQAGVLCIHLAGRVCARGGIPIKWQRRFTSGQHFVVETTNRTGVAAELLWVFSKRGIDIADHASAALGIGWAVLRLHVQTLKSETIAEILCEMRCVKGVLRVFGPHDHTPPYLESALPPREQYKMLSAVNPSPYLCGPAITDGRHFYGRRVELAEIWRLANLALGQAADAGQMAFVTGPKKYGKTSLVNQFLRELCQRKRDCLCLFQRASAGEHWGAFCARLGQQFSRQAGRSAPSVGAIALLNDLRSQASRPVVLAIDEAMPLLIGSAAAGQTADVLDFVRLVFRSPGVFVLWCGVDADLGDYSAPLASVWEAVPAIRLAPLDWPEVMNLLEAGNVTGRGVSISVEPSLAEQICRYVNGNPYWCNLLGEKVFRLEGGASGSGVRFRASSYAEARNSLMENRTAFQDRVGEDPASLEFRILKLLAGAARRNRRRVRFDAIVANFADNPIAETHRALRRLSLRGAARPAAGGQSPTWQIEAPILADYIGAWWGG